MAHARHIETHSQTEKEPSHLKMRHRKRKSQEEEQRQAMRRVNREIADKERLDWKVHLPRLYAALKGQLHFLTEAIAFRKFRLRISCETKEGAGLSRSEQVLSRS